MPLLVLYAFPYRGCGNDATGGLAGAAAYERWIGQVVAGIGGGKAAVILEPDALAQYTQLHCLSPAKHWDRLMVVRRAVEQLVRLPSTAVYVDAGNSRWQPATVMASLLRAVGVGQARGFALNVSNFDSTAAEESYGDSLSALLHGAHYVIDTSRNGSATATTWCNPPGQALGAPPLPVPATPWWTRSTGLTRPGRPTERATAALLPGCSGCPTRSASLRTPGGELPLPARGNPALRRFRCRKWAGIRMFMFGDHVLGDVS